jgi:hypothetical protein
VKQQGLRNNKNTNEIYDAREFQNKYGTIIDELMIPFFMILRPTSQKPYYTLFYMLCIRIGNVGRKNNLGKKNYLSFP